MELTRYRDDYARFQGLNTEVFGASTDSWASHAVFRKQLGLPFDLLSDWGRDVSPKYGAYDAREMTSTRKSFLIDKKGIVRLAQEARLTQARKHEDMVKAVEELVESEGGR